MESVKHWRVHIGAHKTATTHLQDTLEVYRPNLLKRGVDFVPRQSLRRTKIKFGHGIYGCSSWWRGCLKKSHIRKCISSVVSNSPVAVISEENILGTPDDLLKNTLYPRAPERIKSVSILEYSGEVEYFLSLRSFASILASAYVQMIRYKHCPGGFEPIKDRLLAQPPSWVDLVKRVQSATGQSALIVWTMEDYCRNQVAIISSLCGVNVHQTRVLDAPAATRTPSKQAVEKIERLPHRLSKERYRREVSKIVQNDRHCEKYKPFNDEEVRFLEELYYKQIEEIKELPGVRFVHA